jgi:predicted patatin/cPLA2 family phospholipase
VLGVIDVGDGMRDIYGAGVFDRSLDDGIWFDYCIGVSAGSANLSSYLAKQRGRTYRFYTDYSFRREYMSWSNFRKGGSYIDFNYVYDYLAASHGEDPLDYKVMTTFEGRYVIVVTDAVSGEAVYMDGCSMPLDKYDYIKASCSIPLVCKPREIDGVLYYDGGVADPVPLERAIADGCDKIVLILTRPREYRMTFGKEGLASKLINRKYPNTAKALNMRAERYNSAVEKALSLEKEGKCIVIAPDDCCGIDTLTKDKAKLDALYRKGYNDGGAVRNFLEKTES